MAAIGARHRRAETADWLILTPRHAPAETLRHNSNFALKWEGLDLATLRALFAAVPADEVRSVVLATPTGAYARRVWFC